MTRTAAIPSVPTEGSRSEDLGEGISLEWTSRVVGQALVISVFLLNGREAPASKRPPDELWIYQPKLLLRGEGAAFLPRGRLREVADPDPDIASADLIYAKKLEFATGHGVAANWTGEPGGERATSRLEPRSCPPPRSRWWNPVAPRGCRRWEWMISPAQTGRRSNG